MGGRSGTATHNVPRQLTSFIGREDDLAGLRELIADVPLVTVTGAGGAGKTRLALELANDSADLFPDGIWFLELASLADPALVGRTIAEGIGLRTTTDDPLEQIVARIAERDTLIVLDNCEHLLAACAHSVAAIVRGTADAHVIATSREPLHVAGETEFRIAPLSVPDPTTTDLEQVGSTEAVQLFCERARRARRGFTLTEDEAPHVADICRALEGMPLAIELAAARANTLSTADIAARVRERTDFLVSRVQNSVDRQRTLEACIAWSYDLLPDEQRPAFRHLSAFAGEFTAADAADICGENVDTTIESLAERSLLEVVPSDEATRYRMLETIRAFAAATAAEAGEAADDADRHLTWAGELVRKAEGAFDGPDAPRWFERLERANDDLRRALAWGLDRDPARTSELAAGLAKFWARRGQLAEGRRWLEAFEATEPAPEIRIRILQALGDMAGEAGDQREARERYVSAIGLARRIEDRYALVRLLGRLGEVDRTDARYDEGRAVLKEALDIAHEIEDEILVIETEFFLGTIDLFQSKIDAAGTRFEGLRERLAAMNDPRREALMIHAIGFVAQLRGDLLLAARHFEDALERRRRVGDRMHVLNSLITLADVQRSRGLIDEAEAHAREAYRTSVEMGAVESMTSSLSLMAMIAHARGDLRTARGLRHEAAIVSERLGPTYHTYNLGEVAALDGLLGRYDDAERGLREAADAFLSFGDNGHAAEQLAMLADLELRLGRDADASGHLDEAERHASDNPPLRADVDLIRAELLRRAGRYDEARACLDRASTFAEAAGSDPLKVVVDQFRGRVAREVGDTTRALEHLRAALDLSRTLGLRHRLAELLEDIALVAGDRGAHATAMRLCGAAEVMRASSGACLAPPRKTELGSLEGAAVTAIGREDVEGAWALGRALSESRALDHAMTDDTTGHVDAPAERRPEARAADASSPFAVFVREGDYWTIEFGASIARIKDAVGMRYLVHLLENARHEFHAFELVALQQVGASRSARTDDDLAADSREGLEVIDTVARDAYRARIEELRAEIDEAEDFDDAERVSRLQDELDALVGQLASAYGLRGRARQTSSDANRARVAVTKALRTAIRRITDAAPELGEHLGRAVRTGTFCSYDADPLRPIGVR